MVAVREYGLVALIFGALGALIRHVVGRYSNRVQQLEYTVTHDRAGISAEDEVFGRLSVLWENQAVPKSLGKHGHHRKQYLKGL